MKTRQLKVGYQPKPRSGYVPNIRLAGEWLRQAGIEIGQQISVQVLPNQIVITTNLLKENEPAKGSLFIAGTGYRLISDH